MKALILAAGLGTRLMPLTASIPKALVSINGITLLEMTVGKLAGEGYNDIIVNVHHHPDQIIDFLAKKAFKDIRISISDEREQLLDTGGAILKARWFLDGKEPFLVHNVDVISDISLKKLRSAHLERESLATLSVIDRQTRRYFLFDQDLRLNGWMDASTGEIRWAASPAPQARRLAFSGIHLINPRIFSIMQEKGRFSIIDTYLELAGENPVHGYLQPGCSWFDVGKAEQLKKVSEYLDVHPEIIDKR
jgi:NDP-sugar pyrophosphorylase family protein